MPEDPLPNVRNAFIDQGQFYGKTNFVSAQLTLLIFAECPKGHPYFIGDVSRHNYSCLLFTN